MRNYEPLKKKDLYKIYIENNIYMFPFYLFTRKCVFNIFMRIY